MDNAQNLLYQSPRPSTAVTFKNEKIVTVPEELYPLEGSITVPVIVTPAKFDEFWQAVNQEEPADDKHAVLSTYVTRLCLVIRSNLKIAGYDENILLEKDPMDLTDQAIATFVIAATQPCVNRASRLPLLHGLLNKDTTQ